MLFFQARLFIPSEGCSESLSITGTGDILLKELLDTPTRLSREEVLKMSLHDHCILHKACLTPIKLKWTRYSVR